MDSRYSVTVPTANRQNLTTTFKTQIIITAQTAASGIRLGRVVLYDALFGSAILPNSTDCEIEHDIATSTGTVGTSTAYTPNKLDSATAAASTVAGVGATAEPGTIGNSFVNITLNQRASFRWVAAPGSELIGAATNTTGWVQRALSSTYVAKIADTLLFAE